MLPENIAWAVTKFVFWHPVVQDYMMDIAYYHPSKIDAMMSASERRKLAMEYIKQHGNSIWAKIDYFSGKIRILVLFAVVIVSFALIAGWRP